MEKEDHFDKETGFDVAISETGVSVKAKSRIVSTLDRWGGNFFRKKSFQGERAVQTDEQLIALEAKIVQKAGEKLLKRVDEDEDFAMEVLNIAYSREARRRDNKEGVIFSALEILKNEATGKGQILEGPETLSDEFLDRVERYAEDASTEELQERWGRVLAGEIRKPGTFNPKVLRTVDELNSEDAILFESIAKYHVDGGLMKPLMPKIEFIQQLKLVEAGLIVDPGLSNHNFKFTLLQFHGEVDIWGMTLGNQAISIPNNIDENSLDDNIIMVSGGIPRIPVYILTEAGRALCSILASSEYDVALEIFRKISVLFLPNTTRLYDVQAETGRWLQKA